LGEKLRNQILNASMYVMKHPEGITEELVKMIFSDENLVFLSK